MSYIDLCIVLLLLLCLFSQYALKLLGEIVKEHESRIEASLNRIRQLETEVRYLRQRDAELSTSQKVSRPC